MTHIKEMGQSIETDPEMTHMIELATRTLEVIIMISNTFKKVKKTWAWWVKAQVEPLAMKTTTGIFFKNTHWVITD